VRIQVWIAIAVYVLVAILKKRYRLSASLYTILQILSLTLFEKTPFYRPLLKHHHQLLCLTATISPVYRVLSRTLMA